MKFKKGDTVQIIAGKDRGKSGKVLRVIPDANRVSVDGINMYKKHVRPKRQGEKGEVVNLLRPLNASNVMLVCPHCKRGTRVGYRMEGEAKKRYCKKCQASL